MIRATAFRSVLRSLRHWARLPGRLSPHAVRVRRLAVEILEDRSGPCDLFAASGATLIPPAAAQLVEVAAVAQPAVPLVVWTADVPHESPLEEIPTSRPETDDAASRPKVASTVLSDRNEEHAAVLRHDTDLLFAEEWPSLETLFSIPEFATDGLAIRPATDSLEALQTQAHTPALDWVAVDSSASVLRNSDRLAVSNRSLPAVTVNWVAQSDGAYSFTMHGPAAHVNQRHVDFAANFALDASGESGLIPSGKAADPTAPEDFPKGDEVEPFPLPDEIPAPAADIDEPGDDQAGDDIIQPAAMLPPAEAYSTTVTLPRAQNGSLLSGRLDVVSSLSAPQSPVVTPSVVSSAQAANGLSSPNSVFRVSRTSADASSLEVHYTLSAYTGSGVANQSGAAIIGGGAASTDIANLQAVGAATGAEVVVFQLHEQRDYRLGRNSATWFAAKSPADSSEAALFGAYRHAKSGEAFGALVERHRDAVYQTCFRLLGNRHDAEDLVQLVFLALARQQVQFQITLAGWLRMVARNACLTFLRAKRRRTRHEQHTARLDIWHGDDAPEVREELETALSQVCMPLREAVRLRYLDGQSQQDAARIVGCPRGTLAQRAAKGVNCLRDLLAARGHLLR